jgi:two-component system NtrC family sensor kinase
MMKPFNKIIHRRVGPDELAKPFTVKERYKRFRNTLFLVMVAISIIPLIITVGLSHFQYQNLLENMELSHLRWNMESAKKTIGAFVQELHKVIMHTAHEYSFEELSDQEKLSKVFTRLKKGYPGLVDLGVIDSKGLQVTYAGPFNLRSKQYNSEWFDKAMADGVYLSDIYMGYRQVPHFVIAVSNKIPGTETYWVIRASINASTLQEFISTINTEASDDLFIISHNGTLQTTSRYYGEIYNQKYPLETRPNQSGITIVKDKSNPTGIIHAYTYLDRTPWILVLVKQGYMYGQNWSSFKKQLLTISLVSVILGLMVIIRTTNLLSNRIREGDEKREATLMEAGHAGKLASIGRLAAGVAHEINNPLAIVDQKAGLMSDILEMSEVGKHHQTLANSINGIQNAVNRCKVITHRLLGFARRMDVSLEEIDINDLIQEVLSFLNREVHYQRIQVDLSISSSLPVIHSDRGQLQQIFMNILNNSIDAVGKEGRIGVSTKLKKTNTVQVIIKDNGPGIPPDVLKNIYEPFFTTKEAGKGTGLGLAITYGLVKKLGGDISVESRLGKGTAFTIDLPIGDVSVVEE